MRSSFFGLEIARTGLTVSQQGLNVTGHNIANVDTAGYTRQRIVNTAYEPYNGTVQFTPVNTALVGAGARVVIIDQVRSAFLDRQFRSEQSLASYWEKRTSGLTYVESLLEDTSDGSLSASLTAFIASLNVGTTEATDSAQRIAIQRAASNLAQNFNLVYDRLIELQASQNLSVETVTEQINTLAGNIAELNKSIYSYEMTGQPANDLRDKRNLLLDQLSSLVDIEYGESATKEMYVKIGGVDLINHADVNKLECKYEDNVLTGEAKVAVPYWATGSAAGSKLDVKSGELKAHMDLRDNNTSDTPGIPYFAEQLNTLARALAQLVNKQHSAGWTLPTDGNPSVTGINFFEVPTGGYDAITAGNIKLDEMVNDLDDIFNIAFSDKEIIMDEAAYLAAKAAGRDVTQSANQNNIRDILDLFSKTDITMADGTAIGGFESFLDGIVLDIAVTLDHSKKISDTKRTMLSSVDTQRMSISGVSLDEEMTNMLKYQHAYQGASRILTAMDDALETLINRMGRVGL